MAAYSRSLPELARLISTRANAIHDAYQDAGIEQPSFTLGSSHFEGPYEGTMEEDRAQLLEALDELRSLIVGPAGHIFFMSFKGPAWTATLHVLYRFQLPKHVPLDEPISYADLSGRCGLSEAQTRRYVRSAISLRIFSEPSPGMVKHNAASAILATTTLNDWLGMATEDLAPAALKVADSMEMYPSCDQPTQSAFALANGSKGDKDLFAIIGQQPKRMERFANSMAWSMKVPGMEPRYTVDHLGWATNKDSASGWCPKVIVDVGGGTGTLCKAILETYSGVEKAIVEDLPEVAAQGASQVPEHLQSRLEHRPNSFFEQQTVRDADVYLWRCVLHDWPDTYATKILRNQIPALKKGARLLFLERCLEPPTPYGYVNDQFGMSCDIIMQMCANAKERSADDWAALMALADERFRIKSITTPPNSALSIIEVVWDSPEAVFKPSKGISAAQDNHVGQVVDDSRTQRPRPHLLAKLKSKMVFPGMMRDNATITKSEGSSSCDDYAVKPVGRLQKVTAGSGVNTLKRSYSDTIKAMIKSDSC